MLIREMGACCKSTAGDRYDGHLQHLDLSDAAFVGDMTFTVYRLYNKYKNSSIHPYYFMDMNSLQTIDLPKNLTGVSWEMFSYCENLTSVTLNSAMKYVYKVAFFMCKRLASIKVDKDNPYFHSEDSVLFNKDNSELVWATTMIKKYVVPRSVVRIGNSAFSGCSGLTSLTLPSGVTEIGDQAFSGCNSIKSIYAYMATPPTITQDVFEGTVRRNATLYVPVNSYQDYWLSTVWGDFANIKTFEPTPVEPVLTTDRVSETSRYTADGQRQANPVKGLNIVKMSDGTVRKIMVR